MYLPFNLLRMPFNLMITMHDAIVVSVSGGAYTINYGVTFRQSKSIGENLHFTKVGKCQSAHNHPQSQDVFIQERNVHWSGCVRERRG